MDWFLYDKDLRHGRVNVFVPEKIFSNSDLYYYS